MYIQRSHRIGEAGAIHMDIELMVIGDRPNNPELLGCIDRPNLCGLGQA